MKLRLPLIALILACLAAGQAAAADPLRGRVKGLFEPVPESPPPLPGIAVTPEKLALGKMLYFDPRLSESREISCNTCHNISMGGTDFRSSSSGHSSQIGGRRAPTVFNAVFNKTQFWDGRASDLKEQVVSSVMVFPPALLKARGGPAIANPPEVAAAKQHAIEQLKSIPGYVEAFKKAYPSEADPVVYDNVAEAIAVFEATLITPDAPFDRWLKGDDTALSQEQKEGLTLFVDKGCANCHNGINIGGGMFARFGTVKKPRPEFLPPEDRGRFAITKAPGDDYVFKVPGLRNVELMAPYFHSGSAQGLRQAVAIMAETQLGEAFSEDEVNKITAFLKSLTGRQPEVVLPILPPGPPPAARLQP
ncbi:MAG TPA: cytochrome c peroxidase [Methylocella sp.]|nr:cytochrome c peroxidase [Methylocella sp.]